tara:strand:+ start:148 stop:426 length:279 start_codon:yes stop_codon:yes gene_type:complete
MSYNQQYQENPHLFGQVYPEFESFVVEHCKGGKALDLGCGQGRDAIMLAQHGFSVTALDNSSIAIEQLQKESQGFNLVIKTFVADLFAFEIR